MKEIHEFRIWDDQCHLLPQPNKAKFNGIVYVLKLTKDDPLFRRVRMLDKQLRTKQGTGLFGYWKVSRKYNDKELAHARLFSFNIKTSFEPTGEECGTTYDETVACEICGADRKQIGALRLKKASIPKKDISRTIAGDVIVSARFAATVKKNKLMGVLLEPVVFGKEISLNYFQLTASSPPLEISKNTIAGNNPFDLSRETAEAEEFMVSGGHKVKFERTVFKCPKGHLIGSRLISEPSVINSPSIDHYDFFISRQKVGAKQGLLQPEPLYFCSPMFKAIVEEERLCGFDFEVAHIEG